MLPQVMPPEDWGYETDASTYRNHHSDGQQEMTEQISMHFHLPKSCFGSSSCKTAGVFHGWVQMLWLTQLNQALGYKKEVCALVFLLGVFAPEWAVGHTLLASLNTAGL